MGSTVVTVTGCISYSCMIGSHQLPDMIGALIVLLLPKVLCVVCNLSLLCGKLRGQKLYSKKKEMQEDPVIYIQFARSS
jgi:hypothetical protein